MLIDSRTTLHLGVNFVFAPQPVLDFEHSMEFQQRLAAEAIQFSSTAAPSRAALVLTRESTPLEVRVLQPGPPVGQLLILAPSPARTADEFVEEALAICRAFRESWPGQIQLVQRDCSVRYLYDVAEGDAFAYLWERRLQGGREELEIFGRRVLGGGLRFVIPAGDPDAADPQVEIKIESFLLDPRKLYVDVAMTWPNPAQQPGELDPGNMLRETERFATTHVVAFITGDGQ